MNMYKCVGKLSCKAEQIAWGKVHVDRRTQRAIHGSRKRGAIVVDRDPGVREKTMEIGPR